MFIAEEFRKTQRQSHMSANLKYFMENGIKAEDSHTAKVIKTIYVYKNSLMCPIITCIASIALCPNVILYLKPEMYKVVE